MIELSVSTDSGNRIRCLHSNSRKRVCCYHSNGCNRVHCLCACGRKQILATGVRAAPSRPFICDVMGKGKRPMFQEMEIYRRERKWKSIFPFPPSYFQSLWFISFKILFTELSVVTCQTCSSCHYMLMNPKRKGLNNRYLSSNKAAEGHESSSAFLLGFSLKVSPQIPV